MSKRTQIKSYWDICPKCMYFQEETGVCKSLYQNILEYPDRFTEKCNATFFKKDPSIADGKIDTLVTKHQERARNKGHKIEDPAPAFDYTKLKTSNPTLTKKTFIGFENNVEQMTLQGVVNKSAFLILLAILAAAWTWQRDFDSSSSSKSFVTTSSLSALMVASLTIRKKSRAIVTAPLYAVLEGISLGAISAILEARYPGVVIQAVSLTFATFICLLLTYASRRIKPTENFKLGVISATGAVGLVYMTTLTLRHFGLSIPFIHDSGIIGILFSLFVVSLAALNLVLDFDFIEYGVKKGAPHYMEWYSAFGLLATLFWLYIEFLNLLAKSKSRR